MKSKQLNGGVTPNSWSLLKPIPGEFASAWESKHWLQQSADAWSPRAKTWAATMATLCMTLPTTAQSLIYRTMGSASSKLGHTTIAIGDVDLDGRPDFLSCTKAPGAGHAYSGRLGTLVYSCYPLGVSPLDVGTYSETGAGIGDTNGDGVPDFVIGSPGFNELGSNQGGFWLYAGTNGSVLHLFKGDYAPQGLAAALDAVGDLNGDGAFDILAGAPGTVPNKRGAVYVYSGSTFERVLTIEGDGDWQTVGYGVAGTGDLNGDGTPDLAFGAPYGQGNQGTNVDFVSVRSGAGGGELHRFTQMNVGYELRGVGDVDLDGVPDIAISDLLHAVIGPRQGAVYVYSGATWELLHLFEGEAEKDNFGYAIDGGGDLNDDGLPDIVITSFPDSFVPWTDLHFGYVRGYTGLTGAQILAIDSVGSAGTSPAITEAFGKNVAIIGDANGDGRDDIAMGSNIAVLNGVVDNFGKIEVFSGTPLALTSDSHVVSVNNGGAALRLKPGTSHANAIYLVAGSFTGTNPGVAVDGVTVPIVIDAYTLWTIASPNQPPLSKSLSLLDSSGTGLTTLTLPAGIYPSLVGLHVF
ncbi:MAG: hypothetical protein EPO65_10760, partial [Dehalococcoidia bacterium]